MELAGERLPALSIACTEYVFDVCVPYVIHLSTAVCPPSKTPFTNTSYRIAYCGSTSSTDSSQKSHVSQPKSNA